MRRVLLASAALCCAAANARAQCSPAVQKLIANQRDDDARVAVQALVKAGPADDAALHCMGRIFVAMDKPGDAIDWFEKAVAANEQSSLHHLWLANALGMQAPHTSKLKLPFLARRIKSEFDRASQLDPSSIEARHGLIQFYSQAPSAMGGSMEKAHEQAREIGKLSAMRGHMEEAELFDREKDLAGAEREYSAAIAASPDSTAPYSSLGNFYRRQKRFADAVGVYDRVLALKPDALGARLNIAAALLSSGQGLDRAEREIKLWLANPPKDAARPNLSYARYTLGAIYEKQAKKDSARVEYQAALAINPRNEEAKRSLAALK
ncbi:MAG: tetratricopeptide repeat protein [Gemmatimonadaceae bacterium]